MSHQLREVAAGSLELGVAIGALTIRTGFWGPLCCNYNKEPSNSVGNYLGPDIR